jgi:hypothetical protein
VEVAFPPYHYLIINIPANVLNYGEHCVIQEVYMKVKSDVY